MATLDDYTNIRTALLVKIDVQFYWNGSGFITQALAFTDHFRNYVFDGVTYVALGKLLSVSPISSELRANGAPLTITISGVPNSSIQEVINSRLLSAPVYIYRAFFNQSDASLITDLTFDNPLQRYVGYLDNYTLNESWDSENKIATNTITLDVKSSIDIVSKKVSGRLTNPASMKRYFPTDESFDRLPKIANKPVNFGR